CYTSSMPLCIALAVREMRLSPAEALLAATLGGARALGREDVGHLSVGARADFAVLDAPSYLHLAYRPGVPLVTCAFKNGIVRGHREVESNSLNPYR
ncbi:MAG: amidohydrolase family protein, partial [Actinocrinis sp.]